MVKTRNDDTNPPRPEGKASDPISAAEEKAREQLANSYRRMAWDNITHKPVWKRNDKRTDPAPDLGPGDALLSSSTPLPGKLSAGWYDVVFARETSNRNELAYRRQKDAKDWSDNQEALAGLSRFQRMLYAVTNPKSSFRTFSDWGKRDPKQITLFVDDKGNIKPGNKTKSSPEADEKSLTFESDPKEFRDTWTQVVRGYTAGMGVYRLDLTFPYAKSKEEINLKNALEMVRICEKEGAAVSIDKDPNLMARMANPRNKSERRICDEIRRLANKSQENVDKNEFLKQKQAELAHPINADKLTKGAADLQVKATALQKAAPTDSAEDLTAKIKQVDAERQKVNKTLDDITRDMQINKPSPALCDRYAKAVIAAGKSVTNANAVLKEIEAKAKNIPEYQTLVTDMASLDTKVKEVAKSAGVNAQPAELREQSKMATLRDETKQLNAAMTKLGAATTPQEKDAALDGVNHALQKVHAAATDIKSEIAKPDAQGKLLELHASLTTAADDVRKAAKGLRDFETPENAAHQTKLDQTSTQLSHVQAELNGAKQSIDERVDPKAAAQNEMAERGAALKGIEDVGERAQEVDRALDEVSNESIRLNGQIEELKEQLEDEDLDEDEVEELLEKLESLEKQQEALEVKQKELEGIANETANALDAAPPAGGVTVGEDPGVAPVANREGTLLNLDFDETLANIHTHNILAGGIRNGEIAADASVDQQYNYLKEKGLSLPDGVSKEDLQAQVKQHLDEGGKIAVTSFNAFAKPEDNGGVIRKFLEENLGKELADRVHIVGGTPADQSNKNAHVAQAVRETGGAKGFDRVLLIDDKRENVSNFRNTDPDSRAEYAAARVEGGRNVVQAMQELLPATPKAQATDAAAYKPDLKANNAQAKEILAENKAGLGDVRNKLDERKQELTSGRGLGA